jgi:hypothetical protein
LVERDTDRPNDAETSHRRLIARAILLAPAMVVAWMGCGELRRADYTGVPTVVADTLLRYPSGAEITTGMSRLTYIGSLPAESQPAFLVVEGKDCADCNAIPSVLLWSPTAGRSWEKGTFLYPGRILSGHDGHTVLSESRLFWGACADRADAGMVQFLTEYGDGELEPARQVIVVEVSGDTLAESRLRADPRSIGYTLSRVQDRVCFEIPRRVMIAPT